MIFVTIAWNNTEFSGAFGEVRKAIHKATGIERAVKIISKSATSAEEQERLINEVEILRQLVHFWEK
jgi:calcium-dependent protein kinase